MKRSIYALALTLLMSACGTTYNYYTAGLNRTNLSAYRSFAWMPVGKANPKDNPNMMADAKIRDAATEALTARGLTLQQRDPDLLVSYSTTVGRGVRTNYYPNYFVGGVYPGFGMGYGGWYRPNYFFYGAPFAYYGGTSVDREHYKEGTLIIDLIDRRSKQVVWRGFGVGEVGKNHKKNVDDLPKVVNGILAQLSLAPSSAPPAGGSGRPYNSRSY